MVEEKIEKHVKDDSYLSTEIAEIIAYGKTMGACSPENFKLSEEQQWGLFHILSCDECRKDIRELVLIIMTQEDEKQEDEK